MPEMPIVAALAVEFVRKTEIFLIKCPNSTKKKTEGNYVFIVFNLM